MKLSDYKDEEALDILADLVEPVSVIAKDDELVSLIRNKDMKAVKVAIKNHKKEVIEILAILDGVPVEEYHCNVFSLPVKILEILNDEMLVSFFE